MKLLVGVACAIVLLVAGVFIWNRIVGFHAAVEMRDVNFDISCTEAYVRIGQGGGSEQDRSDLDVCKSKGWKAP